MKKLINRLKNRLICLLKGHKDHLVLYSPDIPRKYRTLSLSCSRCHKVVLKGTNKQIKKVYEKHDPYYLMIKNGLNPY